MPLVDLPGHPLIWPMSQPGIRGNSSTILSSGATILDAANETAVGICRIPKSGNIAKVYFMPNAVSVTGTINVKIEGVTSTGAPDDTPLTNGSTSLTLTQTTDSGVLKEAVFSPACAVTRGQLVAVKLENSSGSYTIRMGATNAGQSMFPHPASETPSLQLQTNGVQLVLEYDDGSVGVIPGWIPPRASGVSTSFLTFNSNSAFDEAGAKIVMPFRCRISGVWLQSESPNGGTGEFILYDANSNVIKSVDASEVNVSGVWAFQMYLFDADVTLEANTVYRLALKATHATNNVELGYEAWSVAAHRAAYGQGGLAFQYTQRADGGAWSEPNDSRSLYLGFLITALDQG